MTNRKLMIKQTHDVIIFVHEKCDVDKVTVGFCKDRGTYLLFDDHRTAQVVGTKVDADSGVRVSSIDAGRVFLKNED